MRPLFRPSARGNVDGPSRVGTGVTGGCTRSGFEPEPAFVFLVFRTFTGEGMGFGATGAGAVSSTGPIGSGFSLATGALAAIISASVGLSDFSSLEFFGAGAAAFAVCTGAFRAPAVP